MVTAPFFRRHMKLLIALMVGLGVLAFWVWPIPRGMEKCATHVVQRLQGPGMYDAEVLETGCWGISGSDIMSIDLVSHADGARVTIFRFGRKNADPRLARQDVPPTVAWRSKTQLTVSIDMVSDIEKQVNEKHGVKIEYHVGAVEHR